jgi:hypothetical protein
VHQSCDISFGTPVRVSDRLQHILRTGAIPSRRTVLLPLAATGGTCLHGGKGLEVAQSLQASNPNLPKNIPTLLSESLRACDPDLRQVLMGNVVLTGGGSLFPGFANRLETELSRNFPHVSIIFESHCIHLDMFAGQDPRSWKPHRTKVWWMAGRKHSGESRHFPSTVDQQGRVAGKHQIVFLYQLWLIRLLRSMVSLLLGRGVNRLVIKEDFAVGIACLAARSAATAYMPTRCPCVCPEIYGRLTAECNTRPQEHILLSSAAESSSFFYSLDDPVQRPLHCKKCNINIFSRVFLPLIVCCPIQRRFSS